MTIILSVLMIIVIGLYGFFAIFWLCHLVMNSTELSSNEDVYIISVFKFKELIVENLASITVDKSFPDSLFGGDVYVHAGIIKIKDQHYYMVSPLNYMLANMYTARVYDQKRKLENPPHNRKWRFLG